MHVLTHCYDALIAGVHLTPDDMKIRLWTCGLLYSLMNMILADKQDTKKVEHLVGEINCQLKDHFELTADQNVSELTHTHPPPANRLLELI